MVTNNHSTYNEWLFGVLNACTSHYSEKRAITKSHVKYLESFWYRQASSIGRFHIENGNIPTQFSLPEPMIADFVDNYGKIKTDVHWIS